MREIKKGLQGLAHRGVSKKMSSCQLDGWLVESQKIKKMGGKRADVGVGACTCGATICI